MEISVDQTRCQGTGFCERLAPEVFEVGDDQIAHVTTGDPPASLLGQLEEAEEMCPTGAIQIHR